MKSVTARQKMNFYQQCLVAELTINTYPDASDQPDADPVVKVMYARLMLHGAPILMVSNSPTRHASARQ